MEALEFAEPLFLLDMEFGKPEMKKICDSADIEVMTYVSGDDLKENITKAAAKCLLNGIKLNSKE